MEKNISLYNTLNRKKEVFIPMDEKEVKIYSCGPTVYHYAHIGNMRAYIFADILNRILKTKYDNIKHVINITDVGHLVSDGDEGEDKLEKGSRREGKSVWEIADYYTRAFLNDLELLNIDDSEVDKKKKSKNGINNIIHSDKFIFTRATDYIQEQINLVKKLQEKGYTYSTSDGIYFDTSKFDKYAELAKLDTKNLQAGERVDMGEKRNKTDFALWKFSPLEEQRQMEWIFEGERLGQLVGTDTIDELTEREMETVGFPGWHIECSAMIKAELGKNIDIHTGGIDHIPVHHTNEIAQSECAHSFSGNNRFVNYWCHVNFLQDATGKMSKSNEDFLRIQSIIDKGFSPSAYRYLLLTSSYRSELAFSWESLEAAQNALNKLTKYLHEAAKDIKNITDAVNYKINETYYNQFLDQLYDDINTAGALAIIWEMINSKAEHAYSTILSMNKIFGLDLTYNGKEKEIEDLDESEKEKVLQLIEQRKIARSQKDWATSDKLRDEIKSYGIEVVD